ncbi:diphthine synthase, partial [Thermoproteota archaeon]
MTGCNSLSLEGVNAIKLAHTVYLEVYTSPIDDTLNKQIEKITGKKIQVVTREFVEDGREIIKKSKLGTVVLISYGDPLVATTHMDIRLRAITEGIKTKVIHNASIISAIFGETGLHAYKFGKTVTMTRGASTLQTTVANTVFENLVRRLHTLILLEYDSSSNFFLDPSIAIDSLLSTERELNQNIFSKNTLMIVASRVGAKNQSIICGRISSLQRIDFGKSPHLIIVPGRLHFTEIDALQTLLKMDEKEILDNSSNVVRLAEGMVKKYVKKSWIALEKAKEICSHSDNKDYT